MNINKIIKIKEIQFNHEAILIYDIFKFYNYY